MITLLSVIYFSQLLVFFFSSFSLFVTLYMSCGALIRLLTTGSYEGADFDLK